MLVRHIAIAVLGLMSLSLVSAQTLYKTVGPDGKVSYTDRPPSEGKVEKTLQVEDLPNTAIPPKTLAELAQMERLAKLQKSVASAAAPKVVAPYQGAVLYAASWCGYCRLARAYMNQKGIAYKEVDIDQPDGKMAFVQAGGSGGIPLLVAGGQKLRGFKTEAYDAFFAARRGP